MYLKIITVNNTTNNSIQVTYLVQRTLKLRFRPRVLIRTSFLSFQDNLAIDLLGKNELPWTQISQYWCYCKMKRVAKQFMNFTWLVLYITLGELGREYRGQRNGKIYVLRYLAGLGLSDQVASENIWQSPKVTQKKSKGRRRRNNRW